MRGGEGRVRGGEYGEGEKGNIEVEEGGRRGRGGECGSEGGREYSGEMGETDTCSKQTYQLPHILTVYAYKPYLINLISRGSNWAGGWTECWWT